MSPEMILATEMRNFRLLQNRFGYTLTRRVKRMGTYIVAILILLTALIPLAYTVSTSLMKSEQITLFPPKFIPAPLYLGNYASVFRNFSPDMPAFTWLKNSVWIAGINIIGQLFFAATAAYGFARFRFRFRRLMFVILMASMAIPSMVKILPQYLMFSRWGWTNTFLPLTIPTWFNGAFLTFLFWQFFLAIPRSLDESAWLDGANSLDVFFRIFLPLSKPVLATAGVLTFISNWGNFVEPYIYLHSPDKFTLALVMTSMRSNSTNVSLSPFRAAFSMVYVSPVIVIFFFLQKYFVQGIQLSIAKE